MNPPNISSSLGRGLVASALTASVALVALGTSPASAFDVFTVPNNSSAVTKAIDLSGNKPTSIITTTLSVPVGSLDTVRALGDGSLTNSRSSSETFTARLTMDSKSVGVPESFGAPAHSSVIVPLVDWVTNVAGGEHVFRWVVTASGAAISDGSSLALIGLLAPNPGGVLPSSSLTIKPHAVPEKSFFRIADDSLTTTSTNDIATDGWVGITNSTKTPGTFTMQYELDGQVMDEPYWTTVGAHQSLLVPVGILCDGAKPGTHALSLVAISSVGGLKITGGTFGGVGLPSTTPASGASPVPSEASDGSPMAIAGGPWTTVLSTELDSSGVTQVASASDTESSSWLTVENPTAVEDKISIRQTTDGIPDLDGAPVLEASVAPHSQLLVPAGFVVGNDMPPGDFTFGVQVSSLLPAVQVQAGALRSIAWASPTTP